MGDFLIVSLAEELQAYEDLAQEYQVGFEINDFYDPLVFEDKKRREDIIQRYQKAGIPQEARCMGRSMMCRCLVTTHRSARSQNFVCDRAWRLPKNFR